MKRIDRPFFNEAPRLPNVFRRGRSIMAKYMLALGRLPRPLKFN